MISCIYCHGNTTKYSYHYNNCNNCQVKYYVLDGNIKEICITRNYFRIYIMISGSIEITFQDKDLCKLSYLQWIFPHMSFTWACKLMRLKSFL